MAESYWEGQINVNLGEINKIRRKSGNIYLGGLKKHRTCIRSISA